MLFNDPYFVSPEYLDSLTDEQINLLANRIAQRLARSQVAVIATAQVGDPIDFIRTQDLSIELAIEVAAEAVLVWTMRACVGNADPVLEIDSSDGLLVLSDETDFQAADGEITRTADAVVISLLARSAKYLPTGQYVAELRSLDDPATTSLYECSLLVRDSAGRRVIE